MPGRTLTSPARSKRQPSRGGRAVADLAVAVDGLPSTWEHGAQRRARHTQYTGIPQSAYPMPRSEPCSGAARTTRSWTGKAAPTDRNDVCSTADCVRLAISPRPVANTGHTRGVSGRDAAGRIIDARPDRKATTALEELSPADAVRTLLAASGVDPDDPRLADTPRRVAQAYAELFDGVGLDERAPLRRGDPVPDGLDFVALRGLEFRSTCAHHLLPFSGTVHAAYVPVERLVGIGSIVRSLEILSTRPQLQEGLSQQFADALRGGR